MRCCPIHPLYKCPPADAESNDIVKSNFSDGNGDIFRFADGDNSQSSQVRVKRSLVRSWAKSVECIPGQSDCRPPAGLDSKGGPIR